MTKYHNYKKGDNYMPNWCSTNIQIYHYDEDRLEQLYNDIVKWKNISMSNNGFDSPNNKCWLGNVVLNSGIDTEGLSYRGSIDDIEYDGNQIRISTETAWSPMVQMWKRIVQRYLPAAEITFSAEEPGNGIYCTNDEKCKDRYIIDCWGRNDVESEWEATEGMVVNILQHCLKTDITDVNELLEMFEDDDNLTDDMAIHKWDIVSIDEVD